ncbi:MAG: hypothetical protein K2X48_09460 [Chitinophagaceae bacterium]|nr:hypothetical protein [Chitinophagaceae bacterium]
MAQTLTIKLKNKKARKVLDGLAEMKLIEILFDTELGWSPRQIKQGRDFLESLNQVKLAEKGKVKLKSAQSLLDEL